jgi:hypothetical protein
MAVTSHCHEAYSFGYISLALFLYLDWSVDLTTKSSLYYYCFEYCLFPWLVDILALRRSRPSSSILGVKGNEIQDTIFLE